MQPTILLIEDNEQNRYLTTFLLEKHGYQVAAAGDGPTGVALAAKIKPDAILLDIQLPGMDGYSVAKALRECPSLDHTPIVAVTSYAMAGDREKALGSGCDGYLEKPINPETFVSQIESYLQQSKEGAS
ncbi:MAG: response regulator [Thermoleophilia bacterium]|nr:response regulator [Thermoleophilia bacterium]